eukprot:scaffold2368_cov289-Chaetoceros_neogracile.AAC.13
MSYHNFLEDHDGYGQATTPSINNCHFSKVDFFKGFEDVDVNDPRSTATSSMRYLSYDDDYYSAENQTDLLIFVLLSTVIQITCWVTCPGEVLFGIGVLRIFTAIMFMTTKAFGYAGSELWWAFVWISLGINKIMKRRMDREQARGPVERIPEDVEDPIVLATHANNLPTAIAAHGINSRVPRAMRNTQQGRQGRGNYHEIVPARIVDMGSSSTANGETSQNNMQALQLAVATGAAIPCVHYERKCNIVAPCCGNCYGCRLCHDELSNSLHGRMDRFMINEIICKECNIRQGCSNQCVNPVCAVIFAEYHCDLCNLWMGLSKDPFHCHKCGFCRVGGAENFHHCNQCSMCINADMLETHACLQDKGILVGDSRNAPSWNPYGEAEYSGPPAIAVPERGVGLGLEPSSNRIEEVGINRHRFTFAAVAGSVEMANLNARQLNQQQNVDTFERGMSLFDRYSSQDQDENEIV